MLNFDASYVHSAYFLQNIKNVNHIKKIGDLLITSGKLCVCDPCYTGDKTRNQEMNLIVPTGIYPVLLDEKEQLVNIIFNPKDDIFFWKGISFKRENYPDSIEVDTGRYEFFDKDCIKAIEKNIKSGKYKGFNDAGPVGTIEYESGYESFETEIANSKNNFIGISTRNGDDEYTFEAGFNEEDRLQCISGCLLGKNFGPGFYVKEKNISKKTINHFLKNK